jgi:VCBS repeat-containing protein
VTATDADAGATLKFALVGTAPAGLSFKDDGTYSFDAGDAAYDSLKAGETKTVELNVAAADLAFYDEASKGWKLEAGKYLLSTAASSADVKGTVAIEIQ